MSYTSIKNFLTQVNRAAVKNEPQVRISLSDAVKLQTELTMLLLELKEANKEPDEITYDGGKF
jgi:hypothetical protein